jgi:hypothetical protein
MKLPDDWIKIWQHPSAADRPLQIIHGIPNNKSSLKDIQYYKDLGLGGVVCNVDFDRYMRSEENWKTLIKVIEYCSKIGLIVWLYDEEGYPSGAAGGQVLKKDPTFQAMELVYNENGDDLFIIKPAYEHTHASNNFYASRRYINLLDERASLCFIEKTHEQYWKKLKPFFGNTIQAVFTDEPSLIAVNLGHIPEPIREKVRVVDPVNKDSKSMPCVPWSYEIEKTYNEKYGETLRLHRQSLFDGGSKRDIKIRRQFWALISEQVTKNFFTQIQTWCNKHKISSSGHTLYEEQIIKHIPLYGNLLKVLSAMDIPGLDMLSSEPTDVIIYAWLTAGLPVSAAFLKGGRRIMTEVSDFDQKLSGTGPASIQEIKATAAWQAAWGVTDFSLYYNIEDRSEKHHKEICDYIGRINSILKTALPIKKVLLYYPIYDLWGDFIPVANQLTLESQSEKSRKIISSFMKIGCMLQQSQIPFLLVDHEFLSQGRINSDGELRIGSNSFNTVLIPQISELPESASSVLQQFIKIGGKVLRDDPPIKSNEAQIELLQPEYRFFPRSEFISLGNFVRSGYEILIVTNTSKNHYSGALLSKALFNWSIMDPGNKDIHQADINEDGNVIVDLRPRQTLFFIGLRQTR